MVVDIEPTRSLILGLQRYTFKENFKIKFQKNYQEAFVRVKLYFRQTKTALLHCYL